jgi:hypothetical protein
MTILLAKNQVSLRRKISRILETGTVGQSNLDPINGIVLRE